MTKAVLFDFNGVLLQDRIWHEKAWDELSFHLRNKYLSKEEFDKYIHGRIPQDTLNFLLGHTASPEEQKEHLDRKENLYKKIALDDKENFVLTEGAIAFFERLQGKDILKTIATSSPLILLDFYFENLNLSKWFDRNLVVYNDGTLPGKPAPDVYLKAADNLKVEIAECMVIEDANSGLVAARSAKAGKVILYLNGENQGLLQKADFDISVKTFKEIEL